MGRLAIASDDASGRDRSKTSLSREIGRLAKMRKGSLKREESLGAPSAASSHGCVLSALRELAPERIGPSTLFARLAHRYVTFARCKCVVPHAISWSNGRCKSRLAQRWPSQQTARLLPALVYVPR